MASEDGKKLRGKIALVTGGSRGINKPGLDQAVAEMKRAGGEIAGCAADVGRIEDVKRVVQTVVRRYGGVHVLVNNAGILGPRVTVAEYPLDSWQEVICINLTGPFMVTREVLQLMIPQRQGSIINVSSGVGRSGKARWGAYAVCKFGVEGFTQVLAEELKESGIRVNSVNPGATRTAMRARAYPDEDPNKLPTPEDVTDVFVYLASDASAGVTGTALDAQEWRRGVCGN